MGSERESRQGSKPEDRDWGFIQRNPHERIAAVHSSARSYGSIPTARASRQASSRRQGVRRTIGSCGGARNFSALPTRASAPTQKPRTQLRAILQGRARALFGRAKLNVSFLENWMSTPIPVICSNPSCGAVWFATSMFNIRPGATIQLSQCAAGPCPKCNSSGTIPDGIYTATTASLFNPADLGVLVSAIKELQKRVSSGATREEVEEEIRENYPYLSSLLKFLPKNAAELAAYLTIIIMVCLHFLKQEPEPQTPTVQIQVNVSQTLEQVSADLITNPPKGQKPKQEQSTK